MTPDEIVVRPVGYSNVVRPLQRESESRQQTAQHPHPHEQKPSPPEDEPEEVIAPDGQERLVDLRV